jgi:hypothetical protein
MNTTGFMGVLLSVLAGVGGRGENWYEHSFYLLHEDHHTVDRFEVGRDADPDLTARLIALSRPDVIQIHAKGNPGWTTYPTKIGFTPPKLARDVLGIWRDIARKDGYHFSVYYNIGRDRVIMKRRPAWNRVKTDGTPYERMLCYHSGVAEEYLWPMIREIMDRYHPDGFWFDGSCFTVSMCYCDKCRERFRREQGLAAPTTPDEPGWDAYREMQRQIYREFIRETVAVIHGIDPVCLVAFNWAYSLMMPERPDPGIAYVTGDIANRVEGLSAAAHWYDSLGLPFDLMTQVVTRRREAGPGGEGSGVQIAPKPRGQIEQEMAVIVANGGRYWAWDTPTPESGLVPERLAFLGRVVSPFLRARQEWCLGSRRVPDVSLLNSAAAHYAVTNQSPVVFVSRDNRIDGATDVLSRLHLNYEMIPDWRLAAQDIRSPVLIVEHPKRLTESTVEALVAYVRGGGTLLMTGMGPAVAPRIRELCGIDRLVGPKGPERLVVESEACRAAFDHWLFRAKLGDAEAVVNVAEADGNVHPILMRNSCGRGQAFYVAIPLLSRHGKSVVPAGFTKCVFDRVLPPAHRILTTTAPEHVETVLRRKGGAHVLHLVNLAHGQREIDKVGRRSYVRITDIPPAPKCHVSVRLPAKPFSVNLEPSGAPVEGWRFEDGRLEVDVPPFEIHQMVVMRGGDST